MNGHEVAYRTHPVTVPAGKTVDFFPGNFRYIRVLESTQSELEDVSLSIGNTLFGYMAAGISFRLSDNVSKLTWRNNSGASVTMIIGVSSEEISDDRLLVTGVLNVKEVGDVLTGDTGGLTLPDTATVQIVGDTDQLAIIVSNHDEIGEFYVADSDGSTPGTAQRKGVRVNPGNSLSISNVAAVWIHNVSGATVSYGFMRSKDS